MTDTKEKILLTALLLYNELGTENVTVRDIAKKIGISHGNLCYHFPSTNDIVFALYQKLVADLDTKIIEYPLSESLIEEMVTSSRYAIERFYEYRFLMLDFVSVMRKNEKIREHYTELEKRRNIQFKEIFSYLRTSEIMRPELFPGEYDNLITIWFIVGDFWMAHAEINHHGTKEEKIAHYSNLIFSLFIPFLTPKGLQLFAEYRAKSA